MWVPGCIFFIILSDLKINDYRNYYRRGDVKLMTLSKDAVNLEIASYRYVIGTDIYEVYMN